MGTQALERVGVDRRAPASAIRRVAREAGLLVTLGLVYGAGRLLASANTGSAFDHAREIVSLQSRLHLPDESVVQQYALRLPYLVEGANLYYALAHPLLTASVLLWLGIRRSRAYPHVRWTLVSVTGLALIGHIVYPLAPPRMLPGFVDTGLSFGHSVYGPDTAGGVANQFAAMPSVHVAWSTLIALAMILVARSRWRWLWSAHPLITFAAVVVTANHYWVDGLVALVLLVVSLPALLRPGVFAYRRTDRTTAATPEDQPDRAGGPAG